MIRFVLTGDLERVALADVVSRILGGAEVCSDGWRTEGVTSSAIPLAPTTPRPGQKSAAEKMVMRVFKLLLDHPDDFIVAIDDVEVVNLSATGIQAITGMIRDAVASVLASSNWAADAAQLTLAAKARASFHLLSPMVESYVVASPRALAAAVAGRSMIAANMFNPALQDPEWFDVADAAYLAPPDDDVSMSWARPSRARHPKKYLQYLGSPMNLRNPWYAETRNGVAALRAVDWNHTLGVPGHGQLARALFTDLALWLVVTPPFPGTCSPETWGTSTVRRNM